MSERALLAREVSPRLFAVLSRQLREAREELSLLRRAPRSAPRAGEDESSARQGALEERVRRVGWCLGALVAAGGVDLLHGRPERRGLRWMMQLAAEARAVRLSPGPQHLPELVLGDGAGWEVPFLAAWAVLVARSCQGDLAWSAGERWLAFEAEVATPGLAQRCRALERDFAGLALETGRGRLELRWS